tara:strand:- start:6424 stop:7359 length:936 start_codon:yes stop_codon:yes gene_type:complete
VKILLTGATGFVGRSLLRELVFRGHEVVGTSRSITAAHESLPEHVRFVAVANLIGGEDCAKLLHRVEVVIHCAAVAHGKVGDTEAVNVEATANLARQASVAGVKRFIFISSIGVNGCANARPYTEYDTPEPVESYARSKWKAERRLWAVQRDTGLEIVIVRPPLVYGPDAPGNFGALVRFVGKGLPLPLGAVHNKRSLISRDNLVDLIITCMGHPAAANQVFLAADGEDMSTSELLRRLAIAMGKPSRLIPVPSSLLKLGAILLNKQPVAMRLLGSLQVDITKARECLGWEPPLSVDEGLRRCFAQDQDKP